MVDGVAVVKTVFAGDACGAVPLDKFKFDPDAIGVVADRASAAMGRGWLGCCDRKIWDFGEGRENLGFDFTLDLVVHLFVHWWLLRLVLREN
jgi:hypothetical protein